MRRFASIHFITLMLVLCIALQAHTCVVEQPNRSTELGPPGFSQISIENPLNYAALSDAYTPQTECILFPNSVDTLNADAYIESYPQAQASRVNMQDTTIVIGFGLILKMPILSQDISN